MIVQNFNPPPPPLPLLHSAQVSSLNPATHAYSFWEGVPMSGKAAFGRLFAASKTLKVSTVPASIQPCLHVFVERVCL